MKLASFTAIIIFVIYFFIFSYSTFAAPKVEIKGENNKSIGTHYVKDSPMCLFVMTNSGDETLTIKSVNKTCGGCVEISVSEKEIAPGKTAEIKVRLTPGTLTGPYSKNFFVETNDPKQRFTMFTFSGTSVPVAEIKPSNLMYMGRIDPGTSYKREFLIVPTEKGTEFGKPVAECNYPVEVSSSLNEKGLSVFFGFKPEKNLGNMKCQIKVPILKPEGWPPLEIIVSAAIAGNEVARDTIPSQKESLGEVSIDSSSGTLSAQKLHRADQTVSVPGNARRLPGLKFMEEDSHPTDLSAGNSESLSSTGILTASNSGYYPEKKEKPRRDSPSNLIIEYFHQAGCSDCRMIDTFIIPKIEENFKGRIRIEKYDTAAMDDFLRFAYRRDRLDIRGNETLCMIVNGKHAFSGYKSIEAGLLKQLESSLEQDEKADTSFNIENTVEKNEILRKHAGGITLGTLIIAGLVDGINPCVFSTLVFFMSVLAVAGVRGRKLLLFGSVYCLACFLTYLLLGLGILRFIKLFSGYGTMQAFINRGMFALLVVFAILSFRDAWLFWRTGEAGSVLLRLPESLKNRIHRIIREGTHFKHLLAGAVVTGFLVTLLESVCTGQVYLPALALMAKQYPSSVRWLLYLVIYNVMFIIPLIAIFAAAYAGTGLATMLRWSKRNVVIGKIMLGMLFLGLALLILIMI